MQVMWCFALLCGIISDQVLSEVTGGKVKGCPTEIPIINGNKIVAGRVYPENGEGQYGYDLPELACNGPYGDWYAETQYANTAMWGVGAIIINPGCKVYYFKGYDFSGPYKLAGTGPAVIYNTKIEAPVIQDCGGQPCVDAMLWTCKQRYPSCTPSDHWQTVTEIDNTVSSIPTKFTYEKIVGTTFSHEMKESMGVSDTVEASISAAFWGITASMGVSKTTNYNWGTTDAETKSKSTSYTVRVNVPPKLKVQIREAVGICGGSTIHTPMFKVVDSKTGKMLQKHNGKVTNYRISGKKGKGRK